MADEAERNGADVDLKVAGQEVRLKNIKSLNTLATVATLIVVCLIGYALYTHAQDSKDDRREFLQAIKEQTSAIKEQTDVQREGNCLQVFKDPVQCRRVR